MFWKCLNTWESVRVRVHSIVIMFVSQSGLKQVTKNRVWKVPVKFGGHLTHSLLGKKLHAAADGTIKTHFSERALLCSHFDTKHVFSTQPRESQFTFSVLLPSSTWLCKTSRYDQRLILVINLNILKKRALLTSRSLVVSPSLGKSWKTSRYGAKNLLWAGWVVQIWKL